MNKDCTQEFLDLKNPLIIRTILENLNRSALMLFLQQRGFSINNLKKMPKTKLVDEIIKTFNLPAPGCNTAKKEFYYNVLRQKPDASVCLSNTDRTLIQDLVNTSDIQKRRDIIKMLDAKTIYMLSSYFDIPNAENIDIEELRQIFLLKVEEYGWKVATEVKTEEFFTKHHQLFPNYGGDMETLFLNLRIYHGRRIFCLDKKRHRKILNNEDFVEGIKIFAEHRKNSKGDEEIKLCSMYL